MAFKVRVAGLGTEGKKELHVGITLYAVYRNAAVLLPCAIYLGHV
jgi:hypothetical protein